MGGGVGRHPDQDPFQHAPLDRPQQRGGGLEQPRHGTRSFDPAVPVGVQRPVWSSALLRPRVREPHQLVEGQLEQPGERGQVGHVGDRPTAPTRRRRDRRHGDDPERPAPAGPRGVLQERCLTDQEAAERVRAVRGGGAMVLEDHVDHWTEPARPSAESGGRRADERGSGPGLGGQERPGQTPGETLVGVVRHRTCTSGCGGDAGRPVLHERVPSRAERGLAPADLLRGGPATTRGSLGHRSRRSGLVISPSSPTTSRV